MGKYYNNGQFYLAPPSNDYVLENGQWVLPPEIQAKQYLEQIRIRRMKCLEIIDKISLRNYQAEITEEETLQLVTQYESIFKLLQAGAAGTAKSILLTLQPSTLVTQDDIDFVLAELNIILGE